MTLQQQVIVKRKLQSFHGKYKLNKVRVFGLLLSSTSSIGIFGVIVQNWKVSCRCEILRWTGKIIYMKQIVCIVYFSYSSLLPKMI